MVWATIHSNTLLPFCFFQLLIFFFSFRKLIISLLFCPLFYMLLHSPPVSTTLQPPWKWKWKSLSHVQLFATPWTIQSMEFSRQGYWSGLPFSSPRNLPNRGSNPGLPHYRWILYQLSYQGSPLPPHVQMNWRSDSRLSHLSMGGMSPLQAHCLTCRTLPWGYGEVKQAIADLGRSHVFIQ